MALKIKSKAIDSHSQCTLYGFVYDDRKIKARWLTGKNTNKKNKKVLKNGK